MTAISNNDIARAIYLASKESANNNSGDFFEKVTNFLAKRKLLSKSKEILSKLDEIINKEENRIVVKVWSTQALDHKTKMELDNFLKKRYKAKDIIIKENIDTSLLGGLKIEVNDEVIDLSMKNRIEKLQTHLTRKV